MSKEKQIIEQLEKDICLNLAVTPNPKEERTHQVARLLVKDGWRKQNEGEWVHSEYDDNAACSVCGEEPFDFKEPLRDPRCAQYCPYCGARMRGVNYGTLETWEEIEAENERERNECR